MSAPRCVLTALAALALVAPGCTGSSPPGPGPSPAFPRGGTLRLTLFGWANHEFEGRTDNGTADYTLDPQAESFPVVWELLRCCLTRTLMSYNGRPTDEGGAIVRPDLAAADPTVSVDGLTWTFRLRRGIHYAPPLQRVNVTAQDIIRGIARGLSPSLIESDESPTGFDPINGGFQELYSIIRGADEFERGDADTIAGLEAPNPYTLVVHLTEPHGDLPNRLAMTQTAPVPPSPTDPGARFGVATGHEGGWGRFLVGTGPYMIEGSDQLDFARPGPRQTPVSGYVPGIQITLIRNPSWTSANDPLRPAYPDRIELVLDGDGGAHDREQADLEAGRIDLAYFTEGASAEEHEHLVPKYQADPALRKRLFIYPADFANWLEMNLALPPFDDIHVRKAVNFAYDKRAQQQQVDGGHVESDPATHVVWDSLENNLLVDYDPYPSADFGGDVAAARAEMRRSRYDRDRDGVCDVSACQALRIYFAVPDPAVPKVVRILRRSLAPIGLTIDPKLVSFEEWFDHFDDPTKLGAMTLTGGFKEFPNGSSFFDRFVASDDGVDQSLIGASPEQLDQWGYEVTSVPTVESRYDRCVTQIGEDQAKCWAELDQYLMEDVVPWVPLTVHNRQRLISGRAIHFTYDQFTTLPALDQIALKPGTSPAAYPSPAGPVPAIPDGVYRYTVRPKDYARFGVHFDNPDDLLENTGTTTITLNQGEWTSVITADHKYFAPVNMGHYRGSGDRARWIGERPFFNAITLPEMRWTFDGTALHFHFLNCGTLKKAEPHNPQICDSFRVTFEAHPWVKVG